MAQNMFLQRKRLMCVRRQLLRVLHDGALFKLQCGLGSKNNQNQEREVLLETRDQ